MQKFVEIFIIQYRNKRVRETITIKRYKIIRLDHFIDNRAIVFKNDL